MKHQDIRTNDREQLDIQRAAVPSEIQLKGIFKACKGMRYPERNTLIMALSYYSGLRCSEIAALKLRDVFSDELDPRGSCVIKGKGGKKREIYLNAKPIYKALIEYQNYRLDIKCKSDCLFLNQSRQPFTAMGMNKVMKQIHIAGNMSHCSSHSGRRYFISKVIYKTGNIGLAKQYAGHSDIRTTLLYFEDNPLIKREVAANIWK